MSNVWLSAWVQLRNRLVSPSFVILFSLATNFYLLDIFLDVYAKKSLPPAVQQQIANIFGQGMVVSIYLGSVFEALFLSGMIGFIFARRKKSKASALTQF